MSDTNEKSATRSEPREFGIQSESVPGDWTEVEFSRRLFMRNAGAAAVAGAAAYSAPSVAFAAPGDLISPGLDDDVTGNDIAATLSAVAADMIGPSASLKNSLVSEFDQAASYTYDATWAQMHILNAESIVDANTAEIDAANGSLSDAGLASGGYGTGMVAFFKNAIAFLKGLGSFITDIICRIKKAVCAVKCTATFAACVGVAAGSVGKCFQTAKKLLAIPVLGKVLYAMAIVVCFGLLAASLGACYAALKSCNAACGALCQVFETKTPQLSYA